jgi:tRNA A37 methylthiotransferase MiaB
MLKNKVEAEISFKRWKIMKEKQLEEEQHRKRLQEEKEREQLIEQKFKRKRKDVLLAYSNLST